MEHASVAAALAAAFCTVQAVALCTVQAVALPLVDTPSVRLAATVVSFGMSMPGEACTRLKQGMICMSL